MTTNNKQTAQEPPHTAISTWSGFVYQGKVALLHSLKLIADKFRAVADYQLQLDSVDDFAILDGSGECLSMHQVKAYKERQFAKYKQAIVAQQNKAPEYPGAAVYFHVSRAITAMPDDFSTLYFPVILYGYSKPAGTAKFCGLDEINALIETQIGDIYRQHYADLAYKCKADYLERSRNLLEDIVIDKVINIHHQIQISAGNDQKEIAYRERISFSQFLQKLDTELSDGLLNDDYFFHVIRKHTGEYFKEYCDDFVDDDTVLPKLNGYMSKINQLSKVSLKQFIGAILPHKKGRFNSLTEFKDNTFNGEDFKNGLFHILETLTHCQQDSQEQHPSIFYWQKNNEHYYPTAIRDSQRFANKFCQQMIEAAMEDDLDFLYESGRLVTVDMDCPSIFNAASSARYEEDEDDYHRLSRFKRVSLISLANAEAELND